MYLLVEPEAGETRIFCVQTPRGTQNPVIMDALRSINTIVRNRRAAILIWLLSTLILTACRSEKSLQEAKATRFAMGTIIEITVLDTTADEANAALEAGFAEINRIAALFWEGNPTGPLYAFNHRQTDAVAMPKEILGLLERSQTYSARLQGAFDVTIGTILPLYSFKGDSLRPPARTEIDRLLPFIGYQSLILDQENARLAARHRQTKIGLGAVAKGYGVDCALDAIVRCGVAGALVNAGGDLRTLARQDGRKWRVGIQHPRATGEMFAVLEVDSLAVVTSGDYEKYFMFNGKRIHHLLNPRTGLSADSCQSVTVIAPNAEQADAMATGLFVLGAQEGMNVLQQFPNCEALWINHDGQLIQSAGFGKFISKN